MGYQERYLAWMQGGFLTQEEIHILESLSEEEKEERFYQDLEFGTAGLRGIRGLGTNRMNVYIVRKVTQGYAQFLKERYADRLAQGVYLAYDCRHFSREFAIEAARVFSGNGIPAKIFKHYGSTPQLSFAILEEQAMGGLMLTASHNPADYNGYKAYNGKGCQLSPEEADLVFEKIDAIHRYQDIRYDDQERLVSEASLALDESFVKTLKSLHRKPVNDALRIMYTPLHGIGGEMTLRVLGELGYHVDVVHEQFAPDGDFPTAPKPNPEEEDALKLLLQQGEREKAHLLLATDPDADRLGVLVRHQDAYRVVSGNQLGALLVDYLLNNRTVTRPAAIIKSVVTSDFAADIARRHGLLVENTLTGFKFIGEKVDQLVQEGVQVLFAFEESIGYLPGSYIRDKDGIGAAVVVSEMVGSYLREGKTLFDRLDELYQEYGYYQEETMNIVLEGQEGKNQMEGLMVDIRKRPLDFAGDLEVLRTTDFLDELPGYTVADVLIYHMKNTSWFAIRPSGTEPKLKVYISGVAKGKEEADRYLQTIKEVITFRLEQYLQASL